MEGSEDQYGPAGGPLNNSTVLSSWPLNPPMAKMSPLKFTPASPERAVGMGISGDQLLVFGLYDSTVSREWPIASLPPKTRSRRSWPEPHAAAAAKLRAVGMGATGDQLCVIRLYASTVL